MVPIPSRAEITQATWSMRSHFAAVLSNRSSGVQIPRDICTRLKRYLYSAKCSWIITVISLSRRGVRKLPQGADILFQIARQM